MCRRTLWGFGAVRALAWALVVLSFPVTGLRGESLVLARGGKARARIVVAAEAPRPDRFAAEELARFLRLATGADFAVSEEPAGAGPRLFVGAGAVAAAAPDFAPETLRPEEILIRSRNGDVCLAGGGPRGTLYAVHEFLEREVGIRWWTASATRIPWRPTLRVAPADLRYAPPFEYREPFWFVAFDPAWAARNKANGIQAGGDDLRGGRQAYEGFVHTFYNLIPPDKYFAAHPEWFSELQGVRTFKDAQLCLTDEALRRELVKNLKEKLRANPAATIASVSQNDCFNPCACARCLASDEAEGGPSGTLLRFVNAVAEDVERDFPGVAIDTLAYQYTRRPPRTAKPRPNVIVRLCSIECSFGRPLEDPANRAFLEDLEGWSRIAGRLYVWDYTTDFSHYIQPHPNYGVLAPNLRLFARNHVRGVFEQGAYQSPGSEMAELRAWVLARLLWNPALDARALRKEFLDGYYGPAAGEVGTVLGLLENAVAASGDPLGCYSPPDAKFLNIATLGRAWEVFARAERRTAGRREYARRVLLAKLPFAYVAFIRWDALRKEASDRGISWPWPGSRNELGAWFLKNARAEGVTHISEWQSLEDWAAKQAR